MRLAIIGVGLRGLSVLERAIALSPASGADLEIVLIEPGELGVGVHAPAQPSYLMLNTAAGQATAFSDPAMVPGAPTLGGPSFLSWCQQRNLLPPVLPGDPQRPMTNADFMPRQTFGSYLRWAARWLVEQAPRRVALRHEQQAAVDVRPHEGGARVTLGDGRTRVRRCRRGATGHGLAQNPEPVAHHILRPYPLPGSVAAIPADNVVAIAGMRLAAIDVVAALTEGRGGRFTGDSDDLVYHPSGHEPHMLLFSHHGFLSCARPNSPRDRPKTDLSYLTPKTVQRLRADRSDG